MIKISTIVLWAIVVMVSALLSAETMPRSVGTQPLDAVASDVLRRGGVPGGVEVITGCESLEPTFIAVDDTNTENVMNVLTKSQNSLSWAKRDKAITVTIRTDGGPSIASTDLPEMQLEVHTLSEATDVLLQQPAVQSRLSQLKMKETIGNVGFSSITEHEARTIVVPAGTLRDQLNALAITFGKAVWLLQQRECGGTRIFQLSWVAK